MGPVHPGCMTAKDELKVGHFTSGAPQDLQEEHPLSFPEYITELIFPLSTIQTLSFFFFKFKMPLDSLSIPSVLLFSLYKPLCHSYSYSYQREQHHGHSLT